MSEIVLTLGGFVVYLLPGQYKRSELKNYFPELYKTVLFINFTGIFKSNLCENWVNNLKNNI